LFIFQNLITVNKKKQPRQYISGSGSSRKDRSASTVCEGPATTSAPEVYHRVILRKVPDRGKPTPWVNFNGRYLEKWGFVPGCKIAIQFQDGKIILSIEEPPMSWEQYCKSKHFNGIKPEWWSE
jgi:hypothetical protein